MKIGLLLLLLLGNCLCYAAPCTRSYRFVLESEMANAAPTMGRIALEAILKEAGCKLTLIDRIANFERRLKMLSDGSADVLAESSMRPERLEYALFSQPYRIEFTYLYVLKKQLPNFQGITLDDLATKQWRLADPGSWHGKSWEVVRQSLISRSLTIPMRTVDEGLRDVRLGRADMLLATDSSASTSLNNANDLVRLPFTVNREPVYLIFSRRTVTQHDVDHINEAIVSLKKEHKL